MARLITSGCEWKDLQTTPPTTGSNSFDGSVLSVTNVTVETSLQRSGAACWKVAPTTSTPAYVQQNIAGALATNYYARAYVMIPDQASAPASGVGVMRWLDTAAATLWTVITQTISSTGVTYIISGQTESAEVPYGTWARIEMLVNVNSAGGLDDAREFLLDGTTVSASTLVNLGTVAPGVLRVGFISSPGTSKVIYVDDIAVNDGGGGSQNSYPGSGKIVLLKPASDSAVGSGWTDSGGSGSSLFASVDNPPPTGIADTTSNAGHQIRNASSAAASYDANLETYASAGIKATDTINVLVPHCNTAAPVVTAAKTGSVGIVSNPAIANIAFVNGATAAANFWANPAAGTYSAGWKWEKGTVTYGSSVTVGTAPVMRVSITGGTATRIAMCDAMGLYVDYKPAPSLVAYNRTPRNSLLRR